MSVRVEGEIRIDVSDYSDELELYADCDDIFELMESNNITAGEMIDFLRDGEYRLDIDQVYDWLETSNVPTISAVAKKCIDLMRAEYTEAEDGRVQYRDRFVASEADVMKLQAEQKVLKEASPMHN
jgi:hypothetical protein